MSSPNPYIVASIITASSTTFVGVLSWYNAREARRTSKRTHDVVSGNGKGDVAHMMESLLDAFEDHTVDDKRRFKKVNKELKKIASNQDSARSDSYRHSRYAGAPRGAGRSSSMDRVVHSGEVHGEAQD